MTMVSHRARSFWQRSFTYTCCTCVRTMMATGNSGWDDIIVGTQATPVRFCFEASTCPRGKLRSLFYSNFNASVQFQRQSVPPLDAKCCLLLRLEPNSIYTLSTIATAKKGSHSIDPVVSAHSVCLIAAYPTSALCGQMVVDIDLASMP